MTTSTLSTIASQVSRIKYFRVPIKLTNMIPNVTYTAAINGSNIGPWCKPQGGQIGDPLVSNAQGQLQLIYMYSIPYNTTFLTSPNIDAGLLNQKKAITFTDPLGFTSTSYLNTTLKSN